MARTSKSSPGRGGDDDRQGGDSNRRTNKRNATTKNERSTNGTPINKKSKAAKGGAMDEEATEEGISTKNEGNDDNAKAQHGVMDKTATEEGDSARNNGDATENNAEKETNQNPTLAVRKPSFSNLEKHVISSNTNISPIFAITRALNLETITPSHQAVVKKRRVVPLNYLSHPLILQR